MPSKSILIVDDDSDSRLLLRSYFRDLPYEVTEAADGQAALNRLLSSGPVDLILLDLIMPVMSGLEFLSRLRRHTFYRFKTTPLLIQNQSNREIQEYFDRQMQQFNEALSRIPILIISAKNKKEDIISTREFNVAGYIVKPFRKELVLGKITSVI